MSALPFPDCVPEDCHGDIRLAVEYWLSIHPDEGLPGRQHFDPVDIPRLLPYIRLLDVVGDPPTYRIRLMGTMVAKFYEYDFTGYWYHEAFPAFPGSEAETYMADVVRTGRPAYRNGPPCFFHEKSHRDVERVMLPLARDGRNVDMLLIVHMYQLEPRQAQAAMPGNGQGLANAP